MTKSSALYTLWASFGLTAYEENSVPDDALFPYITYELATDSFGSNLALTASLWYKESSWVNANAKAESIAQAVTGGKYIVCDGGALVVDKSTPFAQRSTDPSDKDIKRIILNYTAEFITSY